MVIALTIPEKTINLEEVLTTLHQSKIESELSTEDRDFIHWLFVAANIVEANKGIPDIGPIDMQQVMIGNQVINDKPQSKKRLVKQGVLRPGDINPLIPQVEQSLIPSLLGIDPNYLRTLEQTLAQGTNPSDYSLVEALQELQLLRHQLWSVIEKHSMLIQGYYYLISRT